MNLGILFLQLIMNSLTREEIRFLFKSVLERIVIQKIMILLSDMKDLRMTMF